MEKTPFKIFPSKGYINSHFQIIQFDPECILVTLEKDGLTQKTIDFSETDLVILREFTEPGIYQAKCTIKNHTYSQFLEISNSMRFGSSELKSVFTFDEIPYTLFLMKDRLIIYDEVNKRMLEENKLSPTEIIKIDPQHLLFRTVFKNKKEEIVNYAIYSLLEFSIIWELTNNYKEISLLTNEKLLWVHEFSSQKILCYSFQSIINGDQKCKVSIEAKSFQKLGKSSYLLAEDQLVFNLVNQIDCGVEVIEKANHLAIDKNGNLFELNEENLTARSLIDNSGTSVNAKLSFSLNLNEDDFLFTGSRFVSSEPDDFDLLVQNLIKLKRQSLNTLEGSCVVSLLPDERIKKINVHHSLFFSSSTIILQSEIESKELKSIRFEKINTALERASPKTVSSNNHSLSSLSEDKSEILKDNIISCSLEISSPSFLLFRADLLYFLIKDNKVIKEIQLSSFLILPNLNDHDYFIFNSKDDLYTVYLFPDFDTPILRDIEILNRKYLRKHSNIWYKGEKKNSGREQRFLSAFSLKEAKRLIVNEDEFKHSEYKDASEYIFEEQYILSSTETLINPQNLEVKDSVVGNIITVSESLNKVVTRREDLLYLYQFDSGKGKFDDVDVELSSYKFKEAYLSPNGKSLVLQNELGKYLLFDIESGEETYFFSGKFLAFSKEGNLIYEENNTRAAKIIDPLTFKDITPPNYHHFRFLSPDGKLYSQVATKRRYFHNIDNKYIDISTFQSIKSDYDFPSMVDDPTKNKVLDQRRSYFESHKQKFSELGINSHENINSSVIVKMEVFTEIGIVGTKVTTEVHFPSDIVYFNYASFSYENKYFGYVGKPPSNGLIQLYKINFDLSNLTLSVVDQYLSRYPKYASWVCGFSKNGYFATYDSTPDTYMIKVDETLFKNKTTEIELNKNIISRNLNFYSKYDNWFVIKGKSFLCFSPSGNYLALSEQGYEPLTLGGYGHQESGALHIAATVEGTIIDSFLDHGDAIKDDKLKKIVFVAFSEDEHKILSMSKDGVVIVRQIDLSSNFYSPKTISVDNNIE